MQLNKQMIAELQRRYAAIERVDPDGLAFASIRKLLDTLSQDDLEMLVNANIKFISRLALNRLH